jgi:phosphate:Na+ symporter
MLLHCVNDAERIGDHASVIRRIIAALDEGNKRLSDNAEKEYWHLMELLTKQAQQSLTLLANGEVALRKQVLSIKDEVVSLVAKYEQEHIMRLREKLCSPEIGILFIELLSEIRKVSRHLANIAERADAFYTQGEKKSEDK